MNIKQIRCDYAARVDHSHCVESSLKSFSLGGCTVCGRLMLVSKSLVIKCMLLGFFGGTQHNENPFQVAIMSIVSNFTAKLRQEVQTLKWKVENLENNAEEG